MMQSWWRSFETVLPLRGRWLRYFIAGVLILAVLLYLNGHLGCQFDASGERTIWIQ